MEPYNPKSDDVPTRTMSQSSAKSSMVGPGTTLQSLQHEGKGLTQVGVGLSITSTIVGGGMVGLPYAIFLCGIVIGFSGIITLCLITHYSTYLYFAIRDTVPGKLGSLYEMAYVL